jgi:hypothetical protein
MIEPKSGNPQVSPEMDAAVAGWMKNHGWNVGSPWREMDPEGAFHIWQEEGARVGRSHALWIAEPIALGLSAEQLVNVLNSEGIAQEIRINYKIRIQERGDGYRVDIVSRRSGETRRLD